MIKLFQAIGTSWGDGTKGRNASPPKTDFNIPDLQGMFIRGVSHRSNNDPDKNNRAPLNKEIGKSNSVGSIQPYATAAPKGIKSAFKAISSKDSNHSHQFKVRDDSGGTKTYYPNVIKTGVKTPKGVTAVAGKHSHEVGGGDLETRPINAYVNWIIKY